MKKSILIIDKLSELERMNALLGFMQTAFAETDGITSNEETADALYHIYTTQSSILKELKDMAEGE